MNIEGNRSCLHSDHTDVSSFALFFLSVEFFQGSTLPLSVSVSLSLPTNFYNSEGQSKSQNSSSPLWTVTTVLASFGKIHSLTSSYALLLIAPPPHKITNTSYLINHLLSVPLCNEAFTEEVEARRDVSYVREGRLHIWYDENRVVQLSGIDGSMEE